MRDAADGRRLQTAASEEMFSLKTFVEDNRKSTSRKNGKSDAVSMGQGGGETQLSGYYIKTRKQVVTEAWRFPELRQVCVCLCVGSTITLLRGTREEA